MDRTRRPSLDKCRLGVELTRLRTALIQLRHVLLSNDGAIALPPAQRSRDNDALKIRNPSSPRLSQLTLGVYLGAQDDVWTDKAIRSQNAVQHTIEYCQELLTRIVRDLPHLRDVCQRGHCGPLSLETHTSRLIREDWQYCVHIDHWPMKILPPHPSSRHRGSCTRYFLEDTNMMPLRDLDWLDRMPHGRSVQWSLQDLYATADLMRRLVKSEKAYVLSGRDIPTDGPIIVKRESVASNDSEAEAAARSAAAPRWTMDGGVGGSGNRYPSVMCFNIEPFDPLKSLRLGGPDTCPTFQQICEALWAMVDDLWRGDRSTVPESMLHNGKCKILLSVRGFPCNACGWNWGM